MTAHLRTPADEAAETKSAAAFWESHPEERAPRSPLMLGRCLAVGIVLLLMYAACVAATGGAWLQALGFLLLLVAGLIALIGLAFLLVRLWFGKEMP